MISLLILVTAVTGVVVCVFAIGWVGSVDRRLQALESASQQH